jgi:hypothetical protein
MNPCQSCGVNNEAEAVTCRACGALLLAAVDPGAPKCRAHPDAPAVGTCGRCGSFGCGACLTPRGGASLCADCAARAALLPWDDRASLGLWRAWWRTSVRVMLNPVQTLEAARPNGALGDSLLFALLSTLVGFVPSFGLGFAALGLGLAATSKLRGLEVGVIAWVLAVYAVMIPVSQIVGVLIFALLDHLMLMLLGARPGSLSISVRANALALGPMLVGLVPGCGLYVFPLWCAVLRVLALKQLHRATAWQAILAVVVPIIALCGLGAVAYAGIVALVLSQALQ